MNKQKLKFWATCPKCKHKFGILPEVILRYLQRCLRERVERLKQAKKKLEAKQGAQRKGADS